MINNFTIFKIQIQRPLACQTMVNRQSTMVNGEPQACQSMDIYNFTIYYLFEYLTILLFCKPIVNSQFSIFKFQFTNVFYLLLSSFIYL